MRSREAKTEGEEAVPRRPASPQDWSNTWPRGASEGRGGCAVLGARGVQKPKSPEARSPRAHARGARARARCMRSGLSMHAHTSWPNASLVPRGTPEGVMARCAPNQAASLMRGPEAPATHPGPGLSRATPGPAHPRARRTPDAPRARPNLGRSRETEPNFVDANANLDVVGRVRAQFGRNRANLADSGPMLADPGARFFRWLRRVRARFGRSGAKLCRSRSRRSSFRTASSTHGHRTCAMAATLRVAPGGGAAKGREGARSRAGLPGPRYLRRTPARSGVGAQVRESREDDSRNGLRAAAGPAPR